MIVKVERHAGDDDVWVHSRRPTWAAFLCSEKSEWQEICNYA